MAHQFDPQHMDRLLDDSRRGWHDPAEVLAPLKLTAGQTVADVGCGPGWFSLEAARQVAPGGKVVGIDLSEAMLARLAERAREQGLENVEPVLAEEPDEWPVPTASCDAALVVNVYHEVDPASMFIGELKRILKPGGRCLLVDWKPEPTPIGPPQAQRIAPDDVAEEFRAAGFKLGGAGSVGPYTYGLTFFKPVD